MNVIRPIVPIQPMEKMTFEVNETPVENGKSFSSIFSNAVKELEQAQAQSNEDAQLLASGAVDNLAAVQIHSMKSTMMLQTTVQLTTRAVNAYKEIMQMQV